MGTFKSFISKLEQQAWFLKAPTPISTPYWFNYQIFIYDVLYPLEKKEIISFDKSKISKVKKWYNICEIFTKNDVKNNSEEFLQNEQKTLFGYIDFPKIVLLSFKDVYYQ